MSAPSIPPSLAQVISRAYTNWPAVHQGRFMWDLLSCIPLDVCAIGSPGGLLGLTAMWLRCNRLLHALRIIFVYGTHIQKLPRPNKIGVYGILWFFLAHVTACAWWGLGNADFNRRAAADRGIKIWTESISSSGAPVTRDSSLGDQYWSSFYWSVTTLVKVPWVMPETWMEQLYTAVIIIIGTFTFSVIIGQVTMQIKALDNARQARSERVDKMRTFCHTRGVTGPIVSDVLQWTVQDQDFASKYVGRQRLANIPASMRGPLLQMMYSQVLESFPFKKGGMADAGCNALLIKLSPIVLTRGMGLIEPNSIAANLYVLHKGCLRVALPKENVTKGQKSKHMRSARVSTSPIRGVKGGGLGLKSTKDFARFRVLERPGSCVGLADLGHTNARYPFHVDCTTVTQLFQISSNDLKIASDAMSSEDHQKCKEILIKEHKAHVDGLKYEPPEPVAAAPAASDSEPKSPLYTETFFKVDEVLSQATGHLDSLKASRTHLAHHRPPSKPSHAPCRHVACAPPSLANALPTGAPAPRVLQARTRAPSARCSSSSAVMPTSSPQRSR